MSDDTHEDRAPSTIHMEWTPAGPMPVQGDNANNQTQVAPPSTASHPRSETSTTDQHTAPTLVIEDGVIPERLRRPLDLARLALALALAAGSVALGWFATGTTSGLEQDLEGGARLLPSAIILVLNIIGGIGTLVLPVAGGVALLFRRQIRQLVEALVALIAAALVLTGMGAAVTALDDPRLLTALSGAPDGSAAVSSPTLGGLLAFITASQLMRRRPWNVLSILVMASLIILAILSETSSLAGLGTSLAIGWAIGLTARIVFGIQTTRPTGIEVAQTLEGGGWSIATLKAQASTARGRRYSATTRSNEMLHVTVLDRDLEGAGLVRSIWSWLRLREEPGHSAFNMRRAVEHAGLMSYAGQAAGVAQPPLLMASEIDADSCLLAHQHIPGSRLSHLPEVVESDLIGAWTALKALQNNQISHRSLNADHLIRDPKGSIWLVGSEAGTIAASDVALRIDTAELLCTLAVLTDDRLAVNTGVAVLGKEHISRALPVLQPVALSRDTRARLRQHKGLLAKLRDRLVELRPEADEETIQLERIKPRTLVMVVVGSIAAYVLLSQLAQVDLATLFTTADYAWISAAVLFSLLTYFGSAWSLTGFVPEKLRLSRTLMAQIAGDFATLVSPPTLGSVAINVRYLQKSGLHPALAAASVGVSGVFTFSVHILLLLGFAVAAGTSTNITFDPPRLAVVIVSGIAVLALGLLAVPRVRQEINRRVRPLLREVGPRLITVAQQPGKMAEGIGGILLLNLSYIAVLYSCVLAFDGSINFALVAVVYLAGATIGQAAPTPGGLGAVEAALAAGLTAAGLDAGTAVSAVLLYRLVTFWAPTIPGYWAFNKLSRDGLL